MTLIFGAVSDKWIVQVGDRLLTQTVSDEFIEWDVLANKSILLLTPNGTASISYSGLAYINGKPTDSMASRSYMRRGSRPS